MLAQAARPEGPEGMIRLNGETRIVATVLDTNRKRSGMQHELADTLCTQVLAREHFLLGALQTEVEALHLGLADGRWYRFTVDPARGGWDGEWLAGSPARGAAADDAESRHPLADVAAHFGREPSRIERVSTRRIGELAELVIEFHDSSRLVAHHRPPPGASSLVWVTH
jgi:hypothetical protein